MEDLELDPYGKKCFEAGKVAARIEGLQKPKPLCDLALDTSFPGNSSVYQLPPLVVDGRPRIITLYLCDSKLVIYVN